MSGRSEVWLRGGLAAQPLACAAAEPAAIGLREQWLQCAANPGCADSMSRLMERLRPMFRQMARRAGARWGVRDAGDIEDLLQDICLKISQQFQSISSRIPKEEAAAELYCRAVAANAAHDSLRSRFAAKRRAPFTVTVQDQIAGSTPESADREILLSQIESLLEGSKRDRAVFWLYYRQGFTAKEIAAIPALGLTNKGVESLIHRMTATLRQRM
ncbi:MAG: sigma-70 family RNA polymerase sigma factor [Bryobacterales bacterium]|nr:sigma-70 family RNA polymerase sigma factor [Bryobacterales bacterium]